MKQQIETKTVIELAQFLDSLELKLGVIRAQIKTVEPQSLVAASLMIVDQLRSKATEMRLKLHG